MVKGLILMRWDERSGVEILVKHPETNEINAVKETTLMQVYSQHEYSGESGMISLTVGPMNLISYYSGPRYSLYLVLILDSEDYPDDFEDCIVDIASILFQNINEDKYLELLPALYQILITYPKLDDHQKLALTYYNDIKRQIVNRLREEGVVDKSELKSWLKDKYRNKFLDVEAIFIGLFKLGIIKESSIAGVGIPSVLIFLIKDIIFFRLPPLKIQELMLEKGFSSQYIDKYLKESEEFFTKYCPSEADSLIVSEILVTQNMYEILKALRTSVLKRSEITGIKDLNKVLKFFSENRIIKIFKDNLNEEYIVLFSDIFVDTCLPEYILNTIIADYKRKAKADPVLIEYLNVLEENFF